MTSRFPVPESDRLVFNGVSSRPRSIAYQPRPLLADQPSSVSDESLQPPLLSDTAYVTIGDEDDTVERENKRPRVDYYDIALAAEDVQRTYAEAMASDEAEQWKQDVHNEIRSHHAVAVWYKTIRDVFFTMRFSQCLADPCFFVRRECDGDDESAVYVVLYVDDLLVGCARNEDAEKVWDEPSARSTLKSLAVARFVLGMEVKYHMGKGELILKQEQFITKMVQKFGCNDAHTTRNPWFSVKTSCPQMTTMFSTTRPNTNFGSNVNLECLS
ncbi:hypothetical protein PsorP6_014791 [Peronosclerospora sorghi]|uniref:Uncharacterized protein n=1 Tax=Peronosclerospora sorghi TaxID=230839 RepID=A0ACC0VS91_9STRA|nr:hypothetical protein PsorP6_014791 [Peronosclerospora sorghi]